MLQTWDCNHTSSTTSIWQTSCLPVAHRCKACGCGFVLIWAVGPWSLAQGTLALLAQRTALPGQEIEAEPAQEVPEHAEARLAGLLAFLLAAREPSQRSHQAFSTGVCPPAIGMAAAGKGAIPCKGGGGGQASTGGAPGSGVASSCGCDGGDGSTPSTAGGAAFALGTRSVVHTECVPLDTYARPLASTWQAHDAPGGASDSQLLVTPLVRNQRPTASCWHRHTGVGGVRGGRPSGAARTPNGTKLAPRGALLANSFLTSCWICSLLLSFRGQPFRSYSALSTSASASLSVIVTLPQLWQAAT